MRINRAIPLGRVVRLKPAAKDGAYTQMMMRIFMSCADRQTEAKPQAPPAHLPPHLLPDPIRAPPKALGRLTERVCGGVSRVQRPQPEKTQLVLPSSVWMDSPRSASDCRLLRITSVVSSICAWISAICGPAPSTKGAFPCERS
jgi:hypothetical protein